MGIFKGLTPSISVKWGLKSGKCPTFIQMLSIGIEFQICSLYTTPRSHHNIHRCFERKQRFIFMTQPKSYAVDFVA